MSQTTTPSGAAVISDPVTKTGEGVLDLMYRVQKRLERDSYFDWARVQSYAFDAVAALIARNAELEAERSALVNTVSEYIAARNDYEDAIRKPNSHAPMKVISHGDPRILRWRNARESLAKNCDSLRPEAGA